jgi:fructose-specific phosphotransferase system IIC component
VVRPKAGFRAWNTYQPDDILRDTVISLTKICHRSMQKSRHNLYALLTFLIPAIGFIGLKLAALAIAVAIGFWTESLFGKLGLTIGWIVGLFVAGLLFMCLEKLNPWLERMEEKLQKDKKYPYTDKYGINYPRPTPEQFGITPSEFKDYNNRFQFEFIKLLLTYGVWLATCVYVLRENLKGIWPLILIPSSIIFGVLMNFLLNHINLKLSQKHPSYPKINKFQKAMGIYHKIRDENSKI